LRKKLEIEAEGHRVAAVKVGEGEASKTRAIAMAKADGDAAQIERRLLAEASGRRQSLLAEAEGKERMLLAEAQGKEKLLVAEATGTRQLAEALQMLSEQGKLIIILDKLPLLFEKGGDAASKVAKEVFGAVAKPFESIDRVSIVDMGGGNGESNAINKLGDIVPSTVFRFLAQAKAQGLDVTSLLKMLKIEPGAALEMLDTRSNGREKTAPTTVASAATTTPPETAKN
jgi:flotillin